VCFTTDRSQGKKGGGCDDVVMIVLRPGSRKDTTNLVKEYLL